MAKKTFVVLNNCFISTNSSHQIRNVLQVNFSKEVYSWIGLLFLIRLSIKNKANFSPLRIFKQQDKNFPINLNELSRP